jgi:hypothetical protein
MYPRTRRLEKERALLVWFRLGKIPKRVGSGCLQGLKSKRLGVTGSGKAVCQPPLIKSRVHFPYRR